MIMTTLKQTLPALLLTLAGTVSTAAFAADEVDLEALTNTCAACHGADGNSTVPTNPKLAGQYESYLVQALKSYRSGDRQNAIMNGFATNLSDAEIKALAEYFSSQDSSLATAERP